MITTQVIDTARGGPAAGIPVELDYFITGHGWRLLGQGVTNETGMVESFGEPDAAGIYRLSFDIAAYQSEAEAFFPSISVTFEVRDPAPLHLPLVLSPYGYSTYRS